MEKITVQKAELLEKLRANRTDHRSIFEEAMDGFAREVTAELQNALDNIRAGRRRDVRVYRSVPRDHTGDYDRAIAMIEMSIGSTIVLTENDFAQYVMDDWGWQDQFLSNTYGSKTATGKFSDRYDVR
jgi:hypothetical protein